MTKTLDNCPTCDRRISDDDDNGLEADDGQRWCCDHYTELEIQPTDEQLYIQILTRTSAGLRDNSYSTCQKRSGEILKSVSHTPTQGVLVFHTKYGTKPGYRTVILTAASADQPLKLMTSAFAATPDDTPTTRRHPLIKGEWTHVLDLEPPKWWRVLDNDNKVIADNLTDERWANRIAQNLIEYGARLVPMQGSCITNNSEKESEKVS